MAAALKSVACSSSFILLIPSSRSIVGSLKPSVLFAKTQKSQLPKGTHYSSKVLPLPPPRVAAPTAQTDQREEYEEVEVGGQESSMSGKFSWRDHWYPFSLVEDLDPKLPTPFQLLGRDVVIWFDRNDDQWVVFADKCPRRFAPLSEGRIDEDGNLQCSYHGWLFDGCGSCTKIPQASSEGLKERAIRSPRACAVRFPSMVSQGVLFAWPNEDGWERAKATKPAWLPDDFNNTEFSSVTIQRDLFYGYDTLMENVSDPSHIDFARHKVTGRRDRVKPLPFKLESSGPRGFEGSNDGNPCISTKFVAPCRYINKVEIDTKLPIVGDQKWVIWICSFNVPMALGKTRSIVVPRWHEHWTLNKVYDGDMIILQGQEKIFLSKSREGFEDNNKQYSKITFAPTQADHFFFALRNRLRQQGHSQARVVQIKQPTTSAFQPIYPENRFEQHTHKCSSCKNAHIAFQTRQKVLTGATIAFCATAGIPSDMQLRIILAGFAISCGVAGYALRELGKNFVYVDYVHAEID